MKKTLVTMTLLAGAVCAYSQGTVGLGENNGYFNIQIFAAQTAANSPTQVTYGGYTVMELQGNTANSYNPVNYAGVGSGPGTTVYPNATPIGNGWDVQLLAAAGSGDALSTLSTVGPVITTWFTTPAELMGSWLSGASVNIPGTSDSAKAATFAIAAWNNEGGTVTSLATAQQDGDPWGISNTGTENVLFGAGTPPFLPATITDFSIGAAAVPEPSTIALGVIGASTLLFRRKK